MTAGRKRGVSAGTVAALVGCGLILVLFLMLMLRFGGSCGKPAADTAATPTAQPAATAQQAALPAATQRVTAAPAPQAATERIFTLTAAGTVAMESAVVKSGYYSEAKAYDFDDCLALLRDDVQADLSLVTLENLVVPGAKVSKLITPPETMRMLRLGGFSTVALGFASSGEQGLSGMQSTRNAAISAGLRPIGIFSDAAEAEPATQITDVNGVRVALLHYTMNPSSSTKSKLKKDKAADLMPLTSQAAEEVAAVRAAGAEVVIVSLHWGSVNSASPTKAQKQLAQSLCAAGADVLIGTGSRRVQAAEWLSAARADGATGRTLCLWSLGCLLSESRSNNAVAGMLAHLTFTVAADGSLQIDAAYTPTFAWRYDVGSVTRYQVVSAVRDAPDAMNSDQRSALAKARARVEERMNGSPLFERIP